tara:strand:- start:2836 stop:3249 length:414 start_codon:yes stop_codon:yes gene_type:complete
MKYNLEIMVSIAVLVILYLKPYELTRYSNTVLGKTLLIIGVIFASHRMGKLAGLLAALVMMVLMYENIEGMEDMSGNQENQLINTLKEQEKCETLKDNIKEHVDVTQYDINCMEGELKIKANKSTAEAGQETTNTSQ